MARERATRSLVCGLVRRGIGEVYCPRTHSPFDRAGRERTPAPPDPRQRPSGVWQLRSNTPLGQPRDPATGHTTANPARPRTAATPTHPAGRADERQRRQPPHHPPPPPPEPPAPQTPPQHPPP